MLIEPIHRIAVDALFVSSAALCISILDGFGGTKKKLFFCPILISALFLLSDACCILIGTVAGLVENIEWLTQRIYLPKIAILLQAFVVFFVVIILFSPDWLLDRSLDGMKRLIDIRDDLKNNFDD